MLLGVAAFYIAQNLVVEQAKTESSRLLSSLSSYLLLYQDQIDDLAASIAGNLEIGQALRRADEKDADSFDILDTRARIGYILNSHVRSRGLVSINVYSRGGKRFQMGETIHAPPIDPAEVDALIREIEHSGLPTLWRGIHDNPNRHSSQRKTLGVARLIQHYSPTTGASDIVGVLTISLNNAVMDRFLETSPLPEGMQMMEVDRRGSIALHTDSTRFGTPLDPTLLESIWAQRPPHSLRLGHDIMLMRIEPAPKRNSTLVVLLPDRIVTQQIQRLAVATFGFVLTALLGVVLLAWHFARSVIAPVRLVSEGFLALSREPEAAHAPLPIRDIPDEVAQLVHGYNDHLLALDTQRNSARELEQAKLAAEAASVAKSNFLTTMSHEIRTPMNGILGTTQLLLQPTLSDQDRLEYARTLLYSGQSLLSLLNDVLDLSAIESGNLPIHLSAVEPARILAEIHALYLGAARSKNLHLEQRWDGPPAGYYLSDGLRLRQMLSNLLANALKFTHSGSIGIVGKEVEHVVERGADHAILEFRVQDTGIGIPREKHATLFQPFSQFDSSSTRRYGGSGLGLSIVRRLAALLGGSVGVESDVGKGSTLWFRIRAQRMEHAEPIARGEQITTLFADDSCRVLARILLVEDHPVNRMVAETLLTQLGATVATASDGQQAVTQITGGSTPDLILMDLHMPTMDGYEATERIRQWEAIHARARIPIVALTAGAFEQDRQRCLAIGMDDFLTKPVNVSLLRQTILRHVPHARSVNEGSATQASTPPRSTPVEQVASAPIHATTPH
ncbi:signal transduction histidine kinase [Candidatus Symbiobacter mobilis CR]|uniref:Virulence sensor protein BvgS n=1 Tax=Candidatus Symbiobacter mobilis CR TaxID=946483 RepID=U5NAJ4_9BURK|nr:signal transduction histidine kinase [Candidatus Symbiobacter mobilis CR]